MILRKLAAIGALTMIGVLPVAANTQAHSDGSVALGSRYASSTRWNVSHHLAFRVKVTVARPGSTNTLTFYGTDTQSGAAWSSENRTNKFYLSDYWYNLGYRVRGLIIIYYHS